MQTETLNRLASDFPAFCETCLKIRTKEGNIKPLVLNKAQLYFYDRVKEQLKDKGKVRLVVVKGRQQGLSTIIEALYFWQTIFRAGISTFILTHESEATKNLFSMAKRFYENFPLKMLFKTKEDSATSLYFEITGSGYKVGTAGNKSVGRSQTIQLFHGSETAFWPHAEEHASGILQAVPDKKDTFVIFESTANGIGNFFHNKYTDSLSPDNDFDLVFIPWYWQDEYIREVPGDFKLGDEEQKLKELYGLNDQQLSWRRNKISELHTSGIDGDRKFKQEYPCTPEEAFIATSYDAYLNVELIKLAMSHDEYVEAYGPVILGVDPSGSGNDMTGFCVRRGRVVSKCWSLNTKDEMEVVGHIIRILQDENVDYAFVDTIGIGAGIYSRLKELGYSHKVSRVNAAEQAMNKELYHNLRAEMWAKLKEWLEDQPAVLPNNPQLLNQLVSVGYYPDSKNRLLMEDKKMIKKDGRPSPDLADALTYTFARPVSLKTNDRIVYNNKGIV